MIKQTIKILALLALGACVAPSYAQFSSINRGTVQGDGTGESAFSAFGKINSNFLLAAPLASPALTGTPTAPTPSANDNSTKLATTAYVDSKASYTGLTSLGIRDTSAAFDVTLAASSSTNLSAGRTLTFDLKNVAHTLALGSTANTITFPSASSYTVIGSGDTGTVTNTMLAGSITLANLATQATNTVVGNATSGSATPTALAVSGCSSSASALIWTTNTGFGCNTSVNAATLGGTTFAAPGPIGSGTPSTGAFTTLTTTGATTLAAGANTPVILFNWGIPVGMPPSGSFPDATGTYVIGQAPSSSATCALSAIANGTAQIICSAATFLNTAADVGRVLTINDSGTYRYFTITTQRSTTGATGTISNGSLPLTGATISGVAITGTAGQFSCTCTGFVVGMGLKLSGTYGGTGSITGYADPTTYVVSATNGTSTFTLQTVPGTAIVTTAGTPTGITYTPQGTTSLANNKLYLSGTPTTNTSAFSVPLPTAFPNVYMYFGANAICASGSGPCASGSAAGVYYATCASTTVCIVYTNALASGKPTIPGSPGAWSGGNSPGAFTQTQSQTTVLTFSIPGNNLGTQGGLYIRTFAVRPSNADTISLLGKYGGTAFGQLSNASVLWYGFDRTIRNTGATNTQVVFPSGTSGASELAVPNAAPSYLAIDSTASQNLILNATLTSSAVDWLFSLGGVIEAYYSP